MIDYCFNCDAPLNTNSDKCTACGYEFSLSKKCVRLLDNSMVCATTNKVCKEHDWSKCNIL